MASPSVLLVGAYERDNFGDLLYLLVTEHYLKDTGVVAAAPFASDMTALLDRSIPAYAPLLAERRFDVVWTVGGQVGALDVERAFRLSAAPEELHRFERASRRRRARILATATGDATMVSPYIPSVAHHRLNADAVTVLNSAGLTGIRPSAGRRSSSSCAAGRSCRYATTRRAGSSKGSASPTRWSPTPSTPSACCGPASRRRHPTRRSCRSRARCSTSSAMSARPRRSPARGSCAISGSGSSSPAPHMRFTMATPT